MSLVFRTFPILFLPVSLFTHASDDLQVFIGAKGGYQWVSDDAYNHSEPRGSVVGVYGGLQLSPTFSWAVGYQHHGELKADSTSINVNTWLIESAVRYDWYLQDNFSLYGRLGAAYWDMEKTLVSSTQLDETGFSPLGEVGVNYDFTPKLSLSAGYQYIDGIGNAETGKYDSHALMLGLTYSFGDNVQASLSEATVEPIQEVVVVEPQPQTLTFPSKKMSVAFSSDSTEVNSDATKSLSEFASVLKRYPQSEVVIVGHADSTGSKAYNQAISEKRAQAVSIRIIQLGAPSTQVDWRGEGELSPAADNRAAEGRAKNRRVEVSLSQFQYQE
ncbi:OmpA family protein [Vibrio rhodolitus]|uniref:OmpA family protein n=1 Tax=Vibrio rhodolitus TaxID=2231649 RepID=UPI000E0A5819|nr:OmpA family protein [Vibrio rhodolitus]